MDNKYCYLINFGRINYMNLCSMANMLKKICMKNINSRYKKLDRIC